MITSLVHLIVELVIVGLTYLPIPEPFAQIVRVIFIVIAVIIVLAFLLPFAGIHLGLMTFLALA